MFKSNITRKTPIKTYINKFVEIEFKDKNIFEGFLIYDKGSFLLLIKDRKPLIIKRTLIKGISLKNKNIKVNKNDAQQIDWKYKNIRKSK